MKFSQYPPQSRDILLTYSTDTEKTDPKKAREQACILAERHFENIPGQLRGKTKKRFWKTRKRFWKSEKTPARCSLIKGHSILIRNLGIMAIKEQGDETVAQSLTSVSADDYLLLMEGELRFSQSIVEKAESKEGEWQLQIQTQISFFTWQRTAGGDPLYNGNARVSSRQSNIWAVKIQESQDSGHSCIHWVL